MRKKFFATLLILISLFLSFTSVKQIKRELSPEELLQTINRRDSYFSVDKVAQKIIAKDPSMLLIDIRSEEQYNKFTLPGAINIPMSNLLSADNIAYLDQNVYDVVLFSNGCTDASIALLLANRKGFNKVFVMKGGLSEWVDKILKPKAPTSYDVVTNEEYEFRKGAREYFLGSSSSEENTAAKPAKKKVVARKKKAVSGGCG